MKGVKEINITFYKDPKRSLPKNEMSSLMLKLEDVVKECFGDIPEYQIFSPTIRPDVEHLVVVAEVDGKIAGFTSSLLLKVFEGKEVLHLGLTCVKSDFRSLGISQKLLSKLLRTYWLRYSFFKKVWISNLACVLSSLGNVARTFQQVYPSPKFRTCPTLDHYLISQAINKSFREQMYIPDHTEFIADQNVFIGCASDTMFEKKENELKYHHRKQKYNKFYTKLLNIDRGDEVLQIGWFNTGSILMAIIKRSFRKLIPKKNRVVSQA